MQQLLSRIVRGVYLAEVLASVLVQLSDLQSSPSALSTSLRIREYFGEIAYESKYAVTLSARLLQEASHLVRSFFPICSEVPCRNVVRKTFEPHVKNVLEENVPHLRRSLFLQGSSNGQC